MTQVRPLGYFIVIIWFIYEKIKTNIFPSFFLFLDLDECQSSPCLNRGHCINLVNEYNCVCQPGYSGASCELGMFTYIFLRKRLQVEYAYLYLIWFDIAYRY